MKAYNSKKTPLFQLLFVLSFYVIFLFLLLTEKEVFFSDGLWVGIIITIIFTAATAVMVWGAVYKYKLPEVLFEINENTLTIYNVRSQASYKLSDIKKVRICKNTFSSIICTLWVDGRKVNMNYFVKDAENIRTQFIDIMKENGITVDEYMEDFSSGD